MPVVGPSSQFVMTFGASAYATATASETGPLKEAFSLFLRSHEQDLQDRFALMDAQQAGLRDFVANVHGGLLQRDAEIREVANQLDDASATVLRPSGSHRPRWRLAWLPSRPRWKL